MDKLDYIATHQYSANHREKLLQDSVCGCFYCLNIFSPKEIVNWISDENGTAICPYCSVDAVIGESGGFPITKEFLAEMHKYWF